MLYGKPLVLFASTIASLVISSIFVFLRCLARLKIRGYGWDDWLMLAGMVCFIGVCVCIIVASVAGLGLRDVDLTAEDQMNAMHAYTIFLPLYTVTLVFIKASICFTLMRLATKKSILYTVYAILALSIATTVIILIVFFNLCHPFSYAWNPTGEGHCAGIQVVEGLSYIISITAILTDFACAIIPSVILWNLQMDARVKASVAVILSLGFLASSATLVRLRYINNYTATVDHIYGLFPIAIWTVVECALGICAGSAPTLKPLVKNLFGSSAFSSSDRSRPITNTRGTQPLTSGHATRSRKYGLNNLTPGGSSSRNQFSSMITSQKRPDNSDAESQKDILMHEPNGILMTSAVDVHSVYDRSHSADSDHKKGPEIRVHESP